MEHRVLVHSFMLRLVNFVLSVVVAVLIGFHQTSAMSILEEGFQLSDESTSSEITLSLWLMPPLPASKELSNQINILSHGGTKGPLFTPHVTLVGGIKCRSDLHVAEVAQTLKQGLAGFGNIPCLVSPKAYRAENSWNQALYLVIEPSAAMLNLCQKARALLGMETEDWTFPPPSTYPHLSMFYGTTNVPDKSSVQAISPFYAYRVALWRTDPASLEGVPSWKEVITLDIS